MTLTHHGLGPLGCKALAIALVDLSSNCLRSAGAPYVAQILVDNVSLKTLKLSGNCHHN
ncbi:unnamed protein product [Tetraodon nigroviridis]|uniref:(spotted green pufferfish) hypothetical protein n=1 Tax=Tetraodon nigroviridis TaxID=99883 RepID=Q4RLU2_TETNG|nr:unnamed protein product [Tetraodon nigroviridis]